jgi:hypothetical protein
MLALMIDVIVAGLLARFVPAGVKRLALSLAGGWLAAIAGSMLTGLAFGWMPLDILSSLTTGLLVHPLVIVGLVWLIGKFGARGKRPTEST